MKAKRIIKLSVWIIFGLLVIGTFVFLFKKSQPKPIEYEVNKVERVPSIQRSIVLTGKISARDEIQIVPQLNGIIAEIMHKPGDFVKAGDVIARIKVLPEMASLSNAESQLQLAKIALEEAKQKYERDTRLFDEGVVPAEEYATVKAAYQRAKENLANAEDSYQIVMTGTSKRNAQGSTTLVRSTIDGTILDIPVKEGNSVIQANSFNAGTTIATIADMRQMIFVGKVDEIDIAKLHIDMPVRIRVGAIEDSSFEGQIEFISPKTVGQEGNNQYEVKAAIKLNDFSGIRSGMSANAEVITEQVKNVLAVPEGALIFEDGKVYVDIVTAQHGTDLTTERREITTGVSDGNMVEVKSGLKEGEQVKGIQKATI